jgi:hypothetical protein
MHCCSRGESPAGWCAQKRPSRLCGTWNLRFCLNSVRMESSTGLSNDRRFPIVCTVSPSGKPKLARSDHRCQLETKVRNSPLAWRHTLQAKSAFITRENINQVFAHSERKERCLRCGHALHCTQGRICSFDRPPGATARSAWYSRKYLPDSQRCSLFPFRWRTRSRYESLRQSPGSTWSTVRTASRFE